MRISSRRDYVARSSLKSVPILQSGIAAARRRDMNTRRRMWQRRVGRKGSLARAKGRRRWLSAPGRRVTFSIRREQSFVPVLPPFHLPAIFLADLASRVPRSQLDAARKFTGRTAAWHFADSPFHDFSLTREMRATRNPSSPDVSAGSVSFCARDFLRPNMNWIKWKKICTCSQSERGYSFIINEPCHFIGRFFYSGGHGIFWYICSFWFY